MKMKLNTIFEILTRLILWWLFLYFDRAEPFIREINPNELWMYKYPVSPSIVPARNLWIIIFLCPIIFLVTEFYITRKSEDLKAAIMALTLSYGLNGFITCLIKIMVGRPRPDFYFRCFPEGTGNDFTKCTGDKESYLDGRKSFPSGHSSFAFTCMVFMSLYIARKFDFFYKRKEANSWKLCACIVPLLVAAGIAISRTCDYHHHYEDIIGGCLLGTTITYVTYRLYFTEITTTD